MTTVKNPLDVAKPGDRIEVTVKGIVGWVGGTLCVVFPDNEREYLSLELLEHSETTLKPPMPKWQDGDVVIGYDAAMTNDGVFRRHDGKWVNELLKTDPRGLDDEYIEIGVDERGYRILVAEGRPVLPEPAAEGEVPHEFEHQIADGLRCAYSDANGVCSMPESDPIHHGGKS